MSKEFDIALDKAETPEDLGRILISFGWMGIFEPEKILACIVRGAKLDLTDDEGRTALHCAQHPAVIRSLVEHGAALETRDNYGCTPLYCAASWSDGEAVHALLELGANLAARDNMGQTPLHNATTPAAVSYLLAAGLEIEARDGMNNTPLLALTLKGAQGSVALLLQKGADARVLSFGRRVEEAVQDMRAGLPVTPGNADFRKELLEGQDACLRVIAAHAVKNFAAAGTGLARGMTPPKPLLKRGR